MKNQAKRKELLNRTKRIVIKIGTNVISDKGKPLSSRIKNIVDNICKLNKCNKEIIIVTSGAVGYGAAVLMQKGMIPQTIPLKQACASVGQPILMEHYKKFFEKNGFSVGQILLTNDILNKSNAYQNARNTIFTLLEKNCIPIVNENDTVSIDELKFGDNDSLAAVVSLLIGADLCVLLSDIDGFYKDYKNKHKAKKLNIVTELNQDIVKEAKSKDSSFSTGGMITKINAAKTLMEAGISMAIINGKQNGALSNLFNDYDFGTIFYSDKKQLSNTRAWLAKFAKPSGIISIDKGAYNALIHDGKSLLPSGITDATGNFESGDVVDLSYDSKVFARGISWYPGKDIEKIKGKNTKEIKDILGYKDYDEIIHRNNLFIFN